MRPAWRSLPRAARIAVPVLATLAAGWALARARTERGETALVTRADVPVTVEVTGVLRAVRTSQVGPPQIADVWDFKLSFLSPEGSKVKAGQPVLSFDASELRRQLEAQRAERDSARTGLAKRRAELDLELHDGDLALAEAEARLRQASMKLDRPDELVAGKEVQSTKLDHELASTEVTHQRNQALLRERAATSELNALADSEARAAAKVREIEAAIESMSVTAPRDGTVIYVSNWRDEKKKVGDACWRGEKVLEIPDLTEMTARGEVDEADAGRLAVAQRVSFRLDAHPDLELEGKVSWISRSVERKSPSSQLRVVRLEIALARTDPERMRPGMRFRGAVEVDRASGVLVVPATAVRLTPAGPVVIRHTALGGSEVPIRLGRRGGGGVEVIAGLAEGERVARRAGGEQ